MRNAMRSMRRTAAAAVLGVSLLGGSLAMSIPTQAMAQDNADTIGECVKICLRWKDWEICLEWGCN